MKKIFLYMAFCSLAIISCRKDGVVEEIPEVSIDTQNSYDDQAAQNFLETHYLDEKGKIKDYVETDTVNKKLSKLNPVILPSGVIYIIRAGAQPTPGNPIGTNDVIRLMSISNSYVAAKTDDQVKFESAVNFRNTISTTGTPEADPYYFYTKNSFITSFNTKYKTSYDHSFFEIEGFREAIQKFKAFDLSDEAGYNLQGVIIVPSRAAYGRDIHYSSGMSYRNRSFVFAVQIYKTKARTAAED